MDGGFTKPFNITAHGTTKLDVIYTNSIQTVDHILGMYESWLAKEKHRFVGLDLEYTYKRKYDPNPQEIAVIQLAMHQHVLVFQYCRYMVASPVIVDNIDDSFI